MDSEPNDVWEKCRALLIPRRMIDGSWQTLLGQTYRRRRADGKWEYRQDPVDADEIIERFV
jgi:hypothetical protein